MPSFTSVVPPEAVHDLGTVDYLVVGAGAASMGGQGGGPRRGARHQNA